MKPRDQEEQETPRSPQSRWRSRGAAWCRNTDGWRFRDRRAVHTVTLQEPELRALAYGLTTAIDVGREHILYLRLDTANAIHMPAPDNEPGRYSVPQREDPNQ